MEVENEDKFRKVKKSCREDRKIEDRRIIRRQKRYLSTQVGRKLEDRKKSKIERQKEVQTTLDASIQDRQRR